MQKIPQERGLCGNDVTVYEHFLSFCQQTKVTRGRIIED
jgi:hypothetical protein